MVQLKTKDLKVRKARVAPPKGQEPKPVQYLFSIDFTKTPILTVVKMSFGFLFQPILLFVMGWISFLKQDKVGWIKLKKNDQ